MVPKRYSHFTLDTAMGILLGVFVSFIQETLCETFKFRGRISISPTIHGISSKILTYNVFRNVATCAVSKISRGSLSPSIAARHRFHCHGQPLRFGLVHNGAD